MCLVSMCCDCKCDVCLQKKCVAPPPTSCPAHCDSDEGCPKHECGDKKFCGPKTVRTSLAMCGVLSAMWHRVIDLVLIAAHMRGQEGSKGGGETDQEGGQG